MLSCCLDFAFVLDCSYHHYEVNMISYCCCLQQPEWHHSSLEYILEGQWERDIQCKKVIQQKDIQSMNKRPLTSWHSLCSMVLIKQRNTQMTLSRQLSLQSWPTVHHGLHSDTHRKWCSTPVKALVECISGWGRTNNQTSSSAEQTSWNLSHNCNTTHLRATLWHRKDKQRGSFLLSKNRELFKS